MADRGGRLLGDRQVLRDDVLRRPRPLPLPQRGVRPVRPRERPPARHVPQRHEVRGRDHRDGARPHARRRGHGRARRPAWSPPAAPAASCTRCSPTASTPREHRGIDRPNFVKPETGAPGLRQGLPPVRRRAADACRSTRRPPWSTPTRWPRRSTTETIAIVGLGLQLRLRHDRPDRRARPGWRWSTASGCTSTAASAGSSCPFGEELGYDIPPFDFRVPGVTSISADTHKYGYSFKGTSTLLFRDKACRNAQYFFLAGWSGGKYMSPGIEGSRSGGLLAATWAAMVQLGREGYLALRRARSSRPPTR